MNNERDVKVRNEREGMRERERDLRDVQEKEREMNVSE